MVDVKSKIMIIRAGALGDTLMLMPSIAHLRASAEIVIVGRYPGIDYLNPYVYSCIDYERAGWHWLFMKGLEKDNSLSIPKVDHVIAFQSDPEGNIVSKLRNCLPDVPVHIFPVFPPKGEEIHIALYMAESFQRAGLRIDALQSFQDARKRPLLAKQDPRGREGRIVLHPGSGSMKKNYPPELWLQLIGALKRTDLGKSRKVSLLLGPAEEGLQSTFRRELEESEIELIFCPERDELLSLLSQAPFYIGHDSGITHLAAMLGTPVIALYKNSSMNQWAPLGPAVKVIRDIDVLTGLYKVTLT